MTDTDSGAFADIHSYLVPGVDDGANDLEDILTSVRRMTELGIRKILTTPHLDGGVTRNDEAIEARLSEVDEAFARAAAAVADEFSEVDFRRGHEVMLDIPDVDFSDPESPTYRDLVRADRVASPPRAAGHHKSA